MAKLEDIRRAAVTALPALDLSHLAIVAASLALAIVATSVDSRAERDAAAAAVSRALSVENSYRALDARIVVLEVQVIELRKDIDQLIDTVNEMAVNASKN